MKDPIKVLIFEDNPRDAELLKEMLQEGSAAEQSRKKGPIAPFYVQNVARLRDGLGYLAAANVDLILLDLALLDSQGLGTFARVQAQAPNVPLRNYRFILLWQCFDTNTARKFHLCSDTNPESLMRSFEFEFVPLMT